MVLIFEQRQQQFLESGQHLHEQTVVGQHPNDTEDTCGTVLREFSGCHTWRWPAHTAPLEHRTSGSTRIQYKFIASLGKFIVSLPLHLYLVSSPSKNVPCLLTSRKDCRAVKTFLREVGQILFVIFFFFSTSGVTWKRGGEDG